jgi:LysM repeat protein
MKRFLPISILALALLLDALLCGFASGAILVSTGVSFYQGWAGVRIANPAVTQAALASGPTYVPFPTYTPLPTYTLYPTYTPAVEALELSAATPQTTLEATPTEMPTQAPDTITYLVQEGDTLETIAAAFGITVDDIISANGLDPANPQIQVGDVLIIPLAAGSEQLLAATATATSPSALPTATATSPAAASATPTATATLGSGVIPTATPSPTISSEYPYPYP